MVLATETTAKPMLDKASKGGEGATVRISLTDLAVPQNDP